ncbi:MAG TPA: DNA polymerase III subunit gamma/tau [Solirubrobacterales bacterium]|jgi:DNA polymerase-3 subunit gamma/tau|nr:DNA polymerase III subunit gamma/tau [Solirubrobacterales bacterium]
MSAESTSLYRRHRPGSFDEVVGQQHVVRTLRNAVEQDKVHHAYLFVGSRGTGKTSMAKILARSLNCERGGPTVTPCGECESCVTIAAGTSIDVIEMDAASNRSVDDVRDLRERVAYAPAGGHWKVYILDEAHMLTKEAWNAFLKTLEEPPPKTVFVLATTESHKVMATIADRCQRFDFQRPSLEQISEVLNRVAATESIQVDDGAVAMIARSASGSFRDALGTLDQLVAFGGNDVGLDEVLEMLGAADAELLFDAVDAVAAEDPKAVLLGVEKMARSGRDPGQFARDLLAHLRFLLVTQTTGEVPTSFVVTATDSARLQAQAATVGPASLIRTIDEIADALTAVREGDDARMAVEIALLKAARPDLDPSTEGLLRRIERLEARLTEGEQPAGPVAAVPPQPAVAKASSAVGPPTAPPAGDPAPVDEVAQEVAAEPEVAAEVPAVEAQAAEEEPAAAPESVEPAEVPAVAAEPEVPAPPAASGDLTLDEIQRVWPLVLDKLSESAPALAATFEGVRPDGLEGEELSIGFPADKTFNKRKAEGPERREALVAALVAVTGKTLRPTYDLLDAEATAPEADVAGTDTDADRPDGVSEEELLRRLKSEFDAEEVS